MSTYSIGDLHGRYDMFTMALDKISFNYENDKMYLLGDIIDINYGAIKIFKHIMKYPDNFELIIGNHEFKFMDMIKAYDTFMLEDGIKQKVKNVMDSYLDAFDNISGLIKNKAKTKEIQSIRNSAQVAEWLKPSKKRGILLDAIIDLIEYLNYDEKKYADINWVLSNTNGLFKTKQFVKELLEISIEEYEALKKFLFSKKMEIKLTYLNKEFLLIHSLTYREVYLPHLSNLESSNQYVIFGHCPVVKIHNIISDNNFNFNFREVFSYIDRFDNHYYNLDMGDNEVAVIRLDDFEEFYVINYKRSSKSEVVPPTESVNIRKVGYKKVDANWSIYKSRKGFSIVTFKDYCMEYFIGVNVFKKQILYKRADYLQFFHVEIIENWYDGQTIEEVIIRVAEDYNTKKDTGVFLHIEDSIRNLQK